MAGKGSGDVALAPVRDPAAGRNTVEADQFRQADANAGRSDAFRLGAALHALRNIGRDRKDRIGPLPVRRGQFGLVDQSANG